MPQGEMLQNGKKNYFQPGCKAKIFPIYGLYPINLVCNIEFSY